MLIIINTSKHPELTIMEELLMLSKREINDDDIESISNKRIGIISEEEIIALYSTELEKVFNVTKR